MYEVCVIPEKGAPTLVLFTVYETLFPTDSHVMVAVVNVLELFTCTKFEGAAGDPVECLNSISNINVGCLVIIIFYTYCVFQT